MDQPHLRALASPKLVMNSRRRITRVSELLLETAYRGGRCVGTGRGRRVVAAMRQSGSDWRKNGLATDLVRAVLVTQAAIQGPLFHRGNRRRESVIANNGVPTYTKSLNF